MIQVRYKLPHDLYENTHKIPSIHIVIIPFESIFQPKNLAKDFNVRHAIFVNKPNQVNLFQLRVHWID